jgi:hypothetical protein
MISASSSVSTAHTSRPFLVCIHDATPAYDRETREMIRDLAPLVGTRLSFAVVPDWHCEWPLASHRDYGRLLRESSEELLLHGYFHERQRGAGPITLCTDRSDEMNGLNLEETRRTLERGQHVFTEVFGAPARGFLAPGWQRGHVRPGDGNNLNHVLGFAEFRSRRGAGTVAGGDGLATSVMESARCCNHATACLYSRFTPGISIAASGRRYSD